MRPAQQPNHRGRRLLTSGVLLGVLATIGVAGPAGTAVAAQASCADPMVLIFDGSINRHAEVRLASAAAGVVVDWGGAGKAAPLGTGNSATDRVQTYPASPGSVGFDFTSGGLHTVKICGSVSHYGLVDPAEWEDQPGTESLREVTSFGSLGVQSYAHAFRGSSGLLRVPATLPATATDLTGMFMEAYKFNDDLSGWDVSRVTTLRDMFHSAVKFNADLSAWNISKVTSLRGTFAVAEAFNSDLSRWDTSQVTNLRGTFSGALKFNADIGDWDTSKVTTMREAFGGSGGEVASFNQDISGWNTSQVTDMYRMFIETAFNQDIGGWETSRVTNMSGMFIEATAFNADIGDWDTTRVKDFSEMFRYAKAFNADLSGWDTSQGVDFSWMFSGAEQFNADIGRWDVSQATNLSGMFQSDYSVSKFDADLSGWDTGKVTDMSSMFSSAVKFNANLSRWDTSHVTKMDGMFYGAVAFNQDLGAWDTRKVISMAAMFASARQFNWDLCDWDTSRVTVMDGMFEGATSFDQNLGCWKVAEVKVMYSMLDDSGLSYQNYDATLEGWSQQAVKRQVSLGAAGVTYSAAAASARAKLINQYQWEIRDSGDRATPQLSDAAPRVGQRITADPATWEPAPKSFGYQWYRQSPAGKVTAIPGATESTYRVRARDRKYQLRVKVTATTDGRRSSRYSEWSAKVTRGWFTAAGPKLSPTAVVGKRLTAKRGAWSPTPTTWKYRWYRKSATGKIARIAGADELRYTPTKADRGHRLMLKVFGRRAGYFSDNRSSAWTKPVR